MTTFLSFLSRPRNLFWTLFAVKVALVLIFVTMFGVGRLFWSDSSLYRGLGEGLFQGEGFASTRFMPLYPTLLGFFLWAFGETWGGILLSFVQAGLAAGTAIMVFLLARRFVSVGWALGAALFFSFEPLVAALHLLLIPETVFVFFLFVFLFFFTRYLEYYEVRFLFISVIGMTAALYTKPAPVYLTVVIALLLLIVWQKPKHAALFFLGALLIMSPWMVRNKLAGGSYDLTTDDSGNICSWGLVGVLSAEYRLDASNWAEAWALPEYRQLESRCVSTGSAARIFFLEYPRAFVTTLGVSTLSLLTNEGYSALLEKSADEQVKRHHNYLTPVVFINDNWYPKLRGALGEFSGFELFAILLGKGLRLVVLLGAAVGIVSLLRNIQTRYTGLLFAIFCLYFIAVTVVSTGFGVGARLRYPIEPLLMVCAVQGLSVLLCDRHAKRV